MYVMGDAPPGHWHRRLNLGLLAAVLALGLYLAAMPVLPWLQLSYRSLAAGGDRNPYRPSSGPAASNGAGTPARLPADNRLVIPKIRVNEAVVEGQNLDKVNIGIWRRPGTSTPDQAGNTVIAGHSFWNGPAQFASLTRLKTGDRLYLYWRQKEYAYTVKETKTVTPDKVEVEAPTDTPRLTLYTCTPYWSAKNRFVVVAEPVKPSAVSPTTGSQAAIAAGRL